MTTSPETTRWAQRCRAIVGWAFKASATLRHPREAAPAAVAAPAADSARPVILLVHGYEGSTGEFAPLYDRLQSALGTRFDLALVDTLDPSMGMAPEENVARIDDYLQRHALQTRELYFVCHSLGGLIGRCYTHQGQAAARVRGLVMIATPNGGINWWNVLPIHWMRSAGFAERFNAAYPVRGDIAYQLLLGTRGANVMEGLPNDGVVGRWSVEEFAACTADPARITLHSYPLDHWALLNDPRVAEDITGFFAGLHDDASNGDEHNTVQKSG